MNLFSLFFKMGIQHIVDYSSYDHILFIITLCGVYIISQWKHIIILVTAFTIGHTITLALSTLNIIVISSALVEFLIPLTIFITSIANIVSKETNFSKKLHKIKYVTALFFGLIHGLGYSNYLKSMLGFEDNIVVPLFSFNIGLELGQLIIVCSILVLSFFFIKILNLPRREWNLVISGAGIGVSLLLMIDRIFL